MSQALKEKTEAVEKARKRCDALDAQVHYSSIIAIIEEGLRCSQARALPNSSTRPPQQGLFVGSWHLKKLLKKYVRDSASSGPMLFDGLSCNNIQQLSWQNRWLTSRWRLAGKWSANSAVSSLGTVQAAM